MSEQNMQNGQERKFGVPALAHFVNDWYGFWSGGAIWRFPYVTAESGGGAFVFSFHDFDNCHCIAGRVGRNCIARKMRNGPIVAFQRFWGKKVVLDGYFPLFH